MFEPIEPSFISFGTISCKSDGVEFLPKAITFKIKDPMRCFPTLKFSTNDIISVAGSTILDENCYVPVGGHYLFIKARHGAIDDFLDVESEDGLPMYIPKAKDVTKRFIAMRIHLSCQFDFVKYFEGKCNYTKISDLDAYSRYATIRNSLEPIRRDDYNPLSLVLCAPPVISEPLPMISSQSAENESISMMSPEHPSESPTLNMENSPNKINMDVVKIKTEPGCEPSSPIVMEAPRKPLAIQPLAESRKCGKKRRHRTESSLSAITEPENSPRKLGRKSYEYDDNFAPNVKLSMYGNERPPRAARPKILTEDGTSSVTLDLKIEAHELFFGTIKFLPTTISIEPEKIVFTKPKRSDLTNSYTIEIRFDEIESITIFRSYFQTAIYFTNQEKTYREMNDTFKEWKLNAVDGVYARNDSRHKFIVIIAPHTYTKELLARYIPKNLSIKSVKWEFHEAQYKEISKADLSWKMECSKILRKMSNMSESKHFRGPVDKDKYKDYYKMIKKPVDMDMIRKRISKYLNVSEFVDDVNLMFENAKTYTPVEENPVHKAAVKLSKYFSTAIEKITSTS